MEKSQKSHLKRQNNNNTEAQPVVQNKKVIDRTDNLNALRSNPNGKNRIQTQGDSDFDKARAKYEAENSNFGYWEEQDSQSYMICNDDNVINNSEIIGGGLSKREIQTKRKSENYNKSGLMHLQMAKNNTKKIANDNELFLPTDVKNSKSSSKKRSSSHRDGSKYHICFDFNNMIYLII